MCVYELSYMGISYSKELVKLHIVLYTYERFDNQQLWIYNYEIEII